MGEQIESKSHEDFNKKSWYHNIFVTIFWPTVNRNLASAQDNPYKFERPLSVSDYFSHRSNDELDYHEDQMAVETHQIDDLKERIDMVDMIAMDETKLRKRRIEVRPRPRVQRGPKPKINKDFPQFPNF